MQAASGLNYAIIEFYTHTASYASRLWGAASSAEASTGEGGSGREDDAVWSHYLNISTKLSGLSPWEVVLGWNSENIVRCRWEPSPGLLVCFRICF